MIPRQISFALLALLLATCLVFSAKPEEPASQGRPITPAGTLVQDLTTRQAAVGALPVDFVRSPDKRFLLAVNSGYGVQFNASGNRGQQSIAVIDLNGVHAVDGYEHPTAVRRRTVLRTGGDVFPHSTGSSGGLDHDHVRPYDPLGPPGQTGDLNDAPLTRFHHRVKTHAGGWQVTQLGLGAYRWVSPHGLVRIVTPRGTRVVEGIRDESGRVIGEIYPAPPFALDLGPPLRLMGATADAV